LEEDNYRFHSATVRRLKAQIPADRHGKNTRARATQAIKLACLQIPQGTFTEHELHLALDAVYVDGTLSTSQPASGVQGARRARPCGGSRQAAWRALIATFDASSAADASADEARLNTREFLAPSLALAGQHKFQDAGVTPASWKKPHVAAALAPLVVVAIGAGPGPDPASSAGESESDDQADLEIEI